jgi:hypothetical protein
LNVILWRSKKRQITEEEKRSPQMEIQKRLIATNLVQDNVLGDAAIGAGENPETLADAGRSKSGGIRNFLVRRSGRSYSKHPLSLLQNSVSVVNLCDLRRASCLGLRSAPA